MALVNVGYFERVCGVASLSFYLNDFKGRLEKTIAINGIADVTAALQLICNNAKDI